MSGLIDVNAQICLLSDKLILEDCRIAILKFPESQMKKFEVQGSSKKDEQGLYFSNYEPAQVWAFAFSAVILFYLTGLGVGAVLSAIKQFTR